MVRVIAVQLDDVRKRLGTVEAVRGVDLTIEAGQVVAMLGPNGAGKTTCISLMLGLRKPTSGQVSLFGMPPSDRRARSRCGVMLQESGVIPSLKVKELVDLFRSYYPHPMKAARAIDLAGLAEQAEVQSSKLSGGQRQRLYFALAVCGDPEIIFLDEPTVGMDVEARRAFLSGIHEFAAAGRTIMLTTHYLAEADELAERIVVMNRGLVIADASPREIKSRVAGKKVRFASPRPLSEVDLDGLDVKSFEHDGRYYSFLSNAPEPVLQRIFQLGLEMTDLEVAGADLEEAFVSLTSQHEESVA